MLGVPDVVVVLSVGMFYFQYTLTIGSLFSSSCFLYTADNLPDVLLGALGWNTESILVNSPKTSRTYVESYPHGGIHYHLKPWSESGSIKSQEDTP